MLLLHGESLAEHGGRAGLRKTGLLDSALNRPLNLLAYGDPNTSGSSRAGFARGNYFTLPVGMSDRCDSVMAPARPDSFSAPSIW